MSTSQYSGQGFRADGKSVGRSGGGAMDEARDQMRELADQVEQEARARGEELRERMEAKGQEQKERAAGTADALADAIRAASTTLRDHHEERLGHFTDEFADQVERFSGYLRDNDVRGLMHNLEDVARRNPTAFLGGTLAAGLVAGRFLRASRRGDGEHDEGGIGSSTGTRPPSHREFASNSPTPELHSPREAADSSSTTQESISLRDSMHNAGGPTS